MLEERIVRNCIELLKKHRVHWSKNNRNGNYIVKKDNTEIKVISDLFNIRVKINSEEFKISKGLKSELRNTLRLLEKRAKERKKAVALKKADKDLKS